MWRRLSPALFAAMLLVAVVNQRAVADDPLPILAESRLNVVWEDGPKRNTLVYKPTAGEPVLVLNKAPFRRGEIRLDVVTDAQAFNISSGRHRINLTLRPAERYRLVLNGQPRQESIELDSEPLRFQNAKWVKLIRDETSDTFQIYFESARNVTISLRLRRDQPLR